MRLAVRSLQLLIGDRARRGAGGSSRPDPEPLTRPDRGGPPLWADHLRRARNRRGAGRPRPGGGAAGHARRHQAALQALGAVAVPELERMVAASIDSANHRLDPWLLRTRNAVGRLASPSGTVTRRLGAYGWVEGPAPGSPGPTPAGLIHAPSLRLADGRDYTTGRSATPATPGTSTSTHAPPGPRAARLGRSGPVPTCTR